MNFNNTINSLVGITFCLLLTLSGAAQSNRENDDFKTLSSLNSKFIQNFINEDTVAHSQIIHKDFVCIEPSGRIVDRKTYMKEWTTGYKDSGYTAFSKTDESIRIFGNMALVRSRTPYKALHHGVVEEGSTIYTDTYIKENGRWWCIQAQLTSVKK